jgi:hypothetical protein
MDRGISSEPVDKGTVFALRLLAVKLVSAGLPESPYGMALPKKEAKWANSEPTGGEETESTGCPGPTIQEVR